MNNTAQREWNIKHVSSVLHSSESYPVVWQSFVRYWKYLPNNRAERHCITVTSNDRHGVSNFKSIECVSNSLLRLSTKRRQGSAWLSLREGNPPVTGGFPAQRDSNGENATISWRHNGTCLKKQCNGLNGFHDLYDTCTVLAWDYHHSDVAWAHCRLKSPATGLFFQVNDQESTKCSWRTRSGGILWHFENQWP